MESTRVDGYAAFDEPVGISRRSHTFLATPVCRGRRTSTAGRHTLGAVVSGWMAISAVCVPQSPGSDRELPTCRSQSSRCRLLFRANQQGFPQYNEDRNFPIFGNT